MARKRNVDAFGKSWSPIDIQNLEKAVKLYERLNVLNKIFVTALSKQPMLIITTSSHYRVHPSVL